MMSSKRQHTCANCNKPFILRGNTDYKKYCYTCAPKIARLKYLENKRQTYHKNKLAQEVCVGGC